MKWRHVFLLPLVQCLETDDMVNGATGAINDTAPTVAQGEINVHSIEVGKREHLFTPNSINALPGDIVTFKFWPGSHSVIRASYGRPCEPYENIQGNEGQGFYSGTMTPDDVDVGRGNVGLSTKTRVMYADEISASHLEPDHQHYLSNLLLLWCTRQLYQLGDGRCYQRGCRALHCFSDSVCSGESTKHSIFHPGGARANFGDALIRKQSTSYFRATVHRMMLLHPCKVHARTPASPALRPYHPQAPGPPRPQQMSN